MKTLLLSVALFLFLSFPSNSFSQESEVSSVISDFIGDSTIIIPETFECVKSMTIQLLSDSGDSLTQGNKYILRYSEQDNYMIMTSAEILNADANKRPEMIIDFENMRMITFLNSSDAKVAVVRSVEHKQIAERDVLAQRFGKLIRTGQTKRIAGNKAEEYRFDTKNEIGTLWLSQGFDIELGKSFSALGLGVGPSEIQPNGIIAELDSIDRTTGKHTKMTILDVNPKDLYSLKISGYIATKLPEALENR